MEYLHLLCEMANYSGGEQAEQKCERSAWSNVSDDEFPLKVRPLKTRHEAKAFIHQHHILTPAETNNWTKDMKHPQKAGMKTLHDLHQQKTTNILHPYDGVMFLGAVTTPSEQHELIRALDEAIGKHEQNLAAAWTAMKN